MSNPSKSIFSFEEPERPPTPKTGDRLALRVGSHIPELLKSIGIEYDIEFNSWPWEVEYILSEPYLNAFPQTIGAKYKGTAGVLCAHVLGGFDSFPYEFPLQYWTDFFEFNK